MKSMIVTGGAGFIGSQVVRGALSRGCRVVVLDALTYAGGHDNLEGPDGDERFVFVEGSINDGSLVARLLDEHRPEAIINVAAETHVDRSIDDAADFIATNINGTFTLLEQARHYATEGGNENFRFVHVSTDEVFGSIRDGAFKESDPYRPNSPYAASKAAADHLVRAYFKTYGLATVITHGSNTYGPRQFPEKLIPLMVQNALEGKTLPVYGDGKNIRDWLYVDDHAEGILDAAFSGGPGESYNIGGGYEVRNIDLVKEIVAILDRTNPRSDGSYGALIDFVTDRPGHDFRYALDISKSKQQLSWSPKRALDTGLQETVRWYLDHQEWTRRRRQNVHDGSRQGLRHAANEKAGGGE